MKTRLAIYANLIGFGFLAGAVFNYFHHGPTSKVVPSLVQEIVAGFGLLWLHMALFLLAFALVHAAAGWLFAFLVQPMARKLIKDQRDAGRLVVVLLFLIAVLWAALESGARFPHSMLGTSFHELVTAGVGYWIRLGAGLVTAAALVGGTVLRLGQWIAGFRRAPLLHAGVGLILIAALAGWIGFTLPASAPFPNDPDRPHVILIGIDGWRLDTLPANGGLPGLMPFVEEFMAESAVIEEAITPLARTFPAWWSVFTGQFPPTHGARFNLIGEEFIQTELTLPRQLGERGYYRLFAMDERRFANFREAHGFDRVVGPGVGAADFVLGGLNDSPLTNLIANFRLGRILFPFTHANRAAHFVYRPETFDRLLQRQIARAPRQPLFLTVHYELAHYPFSWAEGPTGRFESDGLNHHWPIYLETLHVIDQQIAELLGFLERAGILENAVVVLLSDHGEGFPQVDTDTVWTDLDSGMRVREQVWHGTDVLSLAQVRVPLVFRGFGERRMAARTVPGRASLADVYPTLAEWLELEYGGHIDGQSLLPAVLGQLARIPTLAIPVETGFTVTGLHDPELSESVLFDEGRAYYEITRDGRLQMKAQEFERLLQDKQRAVIQDDWILAGYPSGDNDTGLRLVLARISNREIVNLPELLSSDESVRSIAEAYCRIFEAEWARLDCSSGELHLQPRAVGRGGEVSADGKSGSESLDRKAWTGTDEPAEDVELDPAEQN